MKIILLADIKSLGRKGDVKEVADGYARNSLIPKGVAVEANAANLNMLANEEKKKKNKEQQELAAARETAVRLRETAVTVYRKCGEAGRLFGSVTGGDIAEALETLGLLVDKKKIEVSEPIRQLGTYEVMIKLHSAVHEKIMVTVAEEV